MQKVLDHGYCKLIESWGSDERIIESARQSTMKGFQGWGSEDRPGDEKLLKFLWDHKHLTPFEMAGMTVEVQAPIFCFREWHRHRTQSYSELSARYVPMPNWNYVPTKERILEGTKATKNKQAAGVKPLQEGLVDEWLARLEDLYFEAQEVYLMGLEIGIPKELARLSVPVARYSRMRASANLRNWLGFLTLRLNPDAQWEIREYARVIAGYVKEQFPRTCALFSETNNLTD